MIVTAQKRVMTIINATAMHEALAKTHEAMTHETVPAPVIEEIVVAVRIVFVVAAAAVAVIEIITPARIIIVIDISKIALETVEIEIGPALEIAPAPEIAPVTTLLTVMRNTIAMITRNAVVNAPVLMIAPREDDGGGVVAILLHLYSILANKLHSMMISNMSRSTPLPLIIISLQYLIPPLENYLPQLARLRIPRRLR
jgi:hypothetical protein